MPRRGFEKARTGCITCKTRKVKCDEAKPHCLRCVKRGRACAGYEEPPPGSISWMRLLRVRPSTVPTDGRTNSMEMRALDYFRCVVAPALSGPMYTYFWTNPVLQLSVQDVPAQQAILAISLLYEKFDPARNHGSDPVKQELAALSFYNKALKQAATSADLDVALALFLAVLFACVECLRGNDVVAIQHCRHGVQLLQSCKDPPPEIPPIIRHLSIFPFCFGATFLDFPMLPWAQGLPDKPFGNIFEAGQLMDSLLSRTLRMVRITDPYNFSLPSAPLSPTNYVSSLHVVLRDLDAWFHGLQELRRRTDCEGPSSSRGGPHESIYRTVEMRWLVTKIWAMTALSQDELPFEAHYDKFARIVQLGREELAYRESTGSTDSSSVFTFDMGLSPLLHFTALKCQVLPLRLEAMYLMEKLASPRETLWDADVMRAINRRAIELEHDVRLPLELQGHWQGWLDLPDTSLVEDELVGAGQLEGPLWDMQMPTMPLAQLLCRSGCV
ncbi:C6 zinc finger domain-containing protein [Apiospora aurea]|uniref:C6 zinc finger domain-containing protein n=1 Tax=Apiospora aurea TaxID=335848 RepID=A0ABR1Q1U2_9PEZI